MATKLPLVFTKLYTRRLKKTTEFVYKKKVRDSGSSKKQKKNRIAPILAHNK